LSKSKKKPDPLDISSAEEFVEALRNLGSVKKVGAAMRPDSPMAGFGQARKWYLEAVNQNLMAPIRVGTKSKEDLIDPVPTPGKLHAIETHSRPLPEPGQVKRYLLTCAQNATGVHEAFFMNLEALATFYDAEIHVSRFVYNTKSMSGLSDKKAFIAGVASVESTEQQMWWDPMVSPYFSDDRLELAPGLVWCGEMNTLPTAVRPLSGLEVYTGRASGVFPHPKIEMKTVPSSKYEPTKFNYTTGTVTKRNYIQRKAGLKAEFHHTFGALLVEVDSDGDWFCRQVIADSEGVIHDLDVKVEDQKVTTGNHVEAITWGDIHVDSMCKWANTLAFGDGGVLDYLRAQTQFVHDVLDFRQASSHHERHRPHVRFKRWLMGNTDVSGELDRCASWLAYTAAREWCETVVVHSNHHDHLGRWLEEVDARYDPKNLEFWSRMQVKVAESFRNGAVFPNYFHLALEELGYSDLLFESGCRFLDRDESFIVLPEKSGGIECGQHGHAGPNGSRGTPLGLSRIGHRMNIADKHTGEIWDGLYVAGTLSDLTPDWTEGASSWSHTNTVVYPNGKRAQITFWNGKPWAERHGWTHKELKQ
jgi:hypothetical protein